MKKQHPFIVIGAVGLSISLVIHILLVVLGTATAAYWANYTAWFVFLTIGFGKQQASKQQDVVKPSNS